MAIFDYLLLIDTYGVKFNIYIKSKTTYKNYLTFTFSLITYVVFLIILYFEEEDFLYKTNPNISYLKQTDLTSNDFLSIDLFFLPVSFNFHMPPDKYKGNILQHLKKKVDLELHTEIDGVINHNRIIELRVDDCVNVPIIPTDFKLKGNNDEIIHRDTTYCVSGFNFNTLGSYFFDKVDFELNAEFDKCGRDDQDCLYDEEFNKAFDDKHLKITMNILSAKVELNSYSSFNHNYVQTQSSIGEIVKAVVYPIKIKNIGDRLFTKETQKTKLSVYSKPTIDNIGKPVFRFKVNYMPTVDLYQWQYKTFSSGLASTMAIMKVIVWGLSFISHHYCKNNYQNMFINNNFDYQETIRPLAVPKIIANPIEKDSSKEVSLVERIDNKKKAQGFRLSCCGLLAYKIKRYFNFKLTRKQQFYKIATGNIFRTLSVENILRKLYEIKKLKYLLLNCEENLLLSTSKAMIGSENIERVMPENKALNFSDFSIIDDDHS
jgi:hypothetical protein